MRTKLLARVLLLLSIIVTPLRASDYREMACNLGGCPTGNLTLHEKFASWEFVISRDRIGNFESGITDFFRNAKLLGPQDQIESLYFELPKKECVEGRQGMGDLYCNAKSIWTYLQIREGETYKNNEHIYKNKTLQQFPLEVEIIPHVPNMEVFDYDWSLVLNIGTQTKTIPLKILSCLYSK